MIAKVIAHAATRDEARGRLEAVLANCSVWPVKTNASFLVRALEHPDFTAGEVDTGLIGRDGEAMAAPSTPSDEALSRAAASLLSPAGQACFRLNAAPKRSAQFLLDGEPVEINLMQPATGEQAERAFVTERGQVWQLTPWRKLAAAGGVAATGSILSPMPGRIIAVEVAAGDKVTKGQKLLTLEAMKMEHSLTAPFDGVVAELNAAAGAQVQVEALLARIEAETE
jgi:3-methylcrotonyl-CoA carboxylase alpha subunit